MLFPTSRIGWPKFLFFPALPFPEIPFLIVILKALTQLGHTGRTCSSNTRVQHCRCLAGQGWGFQLSLQTGLKNHTFPKNHIFPAARFLCVTDAVSQNEEGNSPQLIHHSHQHEEGVLTDSLLERVREVAKLLICWLQIKESTQSAQTSISAIPNCLE